MTRRTPRLLPITLREGSPTHRLYVVLPWVLVAAVVLYVPFASDVGFAPGSIDKAYRISQLNQTIAFAVAILGLTIVTGWSGQVNLGQSAFVGLGAYTTIILVTDHHWSWVTTLPASAAVCFLAGLVIGLPATRVKGMYLAIVTLSVAYVFPAVIRELDWLTGGVNGKGPARTDARLLAPDWMPFADDRRLSRPLWVYCISVVSATTLFVFARNLSRSRPGRALVATRDDEASAVSFGIPVARYKAVAFGLSSAYGGIAGSLLMMDRPFATDSQYGTTMAIFLVAALVVGGNGTISGAAVGGAIYLFLPYVLAEWARDEEGMPPGLRQVLGPVMAELRSSGGAPGLAFGAAMLLVLFVAPGGCVAIARRVRARIVTVRG